MKGGFFQLLQSENKNGGSVVGRGIMGFKGREVGVFAGMFIK